MIHTWKDAHPVAKVRIRVPFEFRARGNAKNIIGMEHPLKCRNCGDYRFIKYEGVRFEDSKQKKGFGLKIPFFVCNVCGQRESIFPKDRFIKFKDKILLSINEGEYIDMPLKYVFSK